MYSNVFECTELHLFVFSCTQLRARPNVFNSALLYSSALICIQLHSIALNYAQLFSMHSFVVTLLSFLKKRAQQNYLHFMHSLRSLAFPNPSELWFKKSLGRIIDFGSLCVQLCSVGRKFTHSLSRRSRCIYGQNTAGPSIRPASRERERESVGRWLTSGLFFFSQEKYSLQCST